MSKMRFFALQELSNRGPLEVITPSNKLSDYYGSHVFDRKKMQEYLPKEAYKAVTDAIEKGTPISREMADLIANGRNESPVSYAQEQEQPKSIGNSITCPKDVGRILRTFKIKKNVEVTDNGKIII